MHRPSDKQASSDGYLSGAQKGGYNIQFIVSVNINLFINNNVNFEEVDINLLHK
jgi:hypothetical protein